MKNVQTSFISMLVVAGLTMGLARELSGSLYPGMIMHAVYNGLILFAFTT